MIEMNGIAKRFGDRLVLGPVSLTVAPGEVVALVGPNGAGKSTMLRVLAGVLRPSGGTALIGEWDVTRSPLRARRFLGYLPQKLGVPLNTVVRDLAALVAAARGKQVEAAIDALAALGVSERLDATLGEMSGGQRQRVMLALATLGRLEALVLDEPSISLDADGSEEVREAIRAARRAGTAVLFASHHLSDVAELADRIAVVVDGRLVAQGPLPELARVAGVTWDTRVPEPPIERIYRILVHGGKADAALKLVRGGAA